MAEFPGPVIDIPENKSMELLQMLQIKMSTNGTAFAAARRNEVISRSATDEPPGIHNVQLIDEYIGVRITVFPAPPRSSYSLCA